MSHQDPTADTSTLATPAERYLDLLKGCLTRDLYPDDEIIDVTWWKPDALLGPPDEVWKVLGERGWRLVRRPDPEGERRAGLAYPANAETMVGRVRLDNVQALVTDVVERGVPGDLVETGVWRGGTVVFMRALLAVLGDTERTVWVCDSFQGLPRPDTERYPDDVEFTIDDAGVQQMFDDLLGIPVEQVQANFARYGLLDDQVRFLEGWFSETLPDAPIETVAVLRLDGDLYESTMDALVNLEHKVAPGGYVIVDDYGSIAACRQAVTDYREQHGIVDEIHTVDWTGAYWQKSAR